SDLDRVVVVACSHKIGELNLRRTGDHHHAVAQGFTTGFIKKWNVCKEKFGRCAVPVRFNTPLPANPGMENQFERLLFGGVLKDYRAECVPIQVAVAGKDAESELGEQFLFNIIKIDKLASNLIGVEKLSCGKNLAQTLTKRALACGNSARNPYRGHLFFIGRDFRQHWRLQLFLLLLSSLS